MFLDPLCAFGGRGGRLTLLLHLPLEAGGRLGRLRLQLPDPALQRLALCLKALHLRCRRRQLAPGRIPGALRLAEAFLQLGLRGLAPLDAILALTSQIDRFAQLLLQFGRLPFQLLRPRTHLGYPGFELDAHGLRRLCPLLMIAGKLGRLLGARPRIGQGSFQFGGSLLGGVHALGEYPVTGFRLLGPLLKLCDPLGRLLQLLDLPSSAGGAPAGLLSFSLHRLQLLFELTHAALEPRGGFPCSPDLRIAATRDGGTLQFTGASLCLLHTGFELLGSRRSRLQLLGELAGGFRRIPLLLLQLPSQEFELILQCVQNLCFLLLFLLELRGRLLFLLLFGSGFRRSLVASTEAQPPGLAPHLREREAENRDQQEEHADASCSQLHRSPWLQRRFADGCVGVIDLHHAFHFSLDRQREIGLNELHGLTGPASKGDPIFAEHLR